LHSGNNFVVIAVDNTRLRDGVPTLKTDWWNYGGLTRDVSLLQVPEKYIDDFDLHLQRGSKNEIAGYVHVQGAGAGEPVFVCIAQAGIVQQAATDASGRASISIRAPGLELWSPEHPKLYRVEIQAGSGAGHDVLTDDIGFRTIEVRGTEILLNGIPIFLRGVSIHGEAPLRGGRPTSEKDDATLLQWAKEMGANFVRLPHYPQDASMMRLADRMGILVWEEVPVYWAIEFDNPQVLAKAQQQLTEIIRRDRDKASVIFWSVANETPVTPARNTFLQAMIASARAQDSTRLVTAALLSSRHGNQIQVNDPLGAYLDVVSFNEYAGWYQGTPQDVANIRITSIYQKPLLLSEFGAGAKAGFHADAETRWSEEFQANVYRQQLKMLHGIPNLRGMCPWVLVDFRSPLRELPGIQDFYNRKGLISDQGQKKQAYFVMQNAYLQRTVGNAK
jgi:beta-glucuronidase